MSCAAITCLTPTFVEMFEIRIEKRDDRELVNRWRKLAEELEAGNFQFRVKEDQLASFSTSAELSEQDQYPFLEPFVNLEGSFLNAEMNVAALSILLTRETYFDAVVIRTGGGGQSRLVKAAECLAAVKGIFREVDQGAWINESLSDDQKRYFEAREASLLRLEQVTERLIKQNEEYRQKVDTDGAEFRAALQQEFKERSESLDKRSSDLDEREREMDLADAKSARRKMRQDLLMKLQPEIAVKLKGSDTWKVHAIFLGVTAVLVVLSGTIATSEGFNLLDWAHALKLGLPVAGLIGTLTLYYRWVDSWIRKDIDEELRLRQLSIDVDRSTWIVEVLSELKEESAGIPEEVLTAVTRNLFAGPEPMAEVSHPTEDMLRQLLDAVKSKKS